MLPRTQTSLEDILEESVLIQATMAGRSLAEYEADKMRRRSVERCFEIIGEALTRLERDDPALVSRNTDYRRIVGYRNRLAHGYDNIDNTIVMEIVQTYLPQLHAEVEGLLAETE